jgi:SAM-dependent methyltransferase
MFKFPEFENATLFYILFALFVMVALIYFFRTIGKTPTVEGFTQMQKFILKQDDAAYDPFYAHIYDEIHLPEERCSKELKLILEATGLTEGTLDDSIVFLDVGSGTGETLKTLDAANLRCFGIDKSQAMIEKATEKCGKQVKIRRGDVTDSMNYDKYTFSHILCLYHTIYEIENKRKFFQNCRYWLKNGGMLIVHLVDKKKFNTVVPVGTPDLIDNPQKYANKRITKTTVDFMDFVYDSKYDIKEGPVSIFTEKFTDSATKKVRQNERRLFMESEDEILKMATNEGLTLYGKINLEPVIHDEHQSLYLLV